MVLESYTSADRKGSIIQQLCSQMGISRLNVTDNQSRVKIQQIYRVKQLQWRKIDWQIDRMAEVNIFYSELLIIGEHSSNNKN